MRIALHHTATSRDRTTFEAINRYHRDVRKFPISSLGYHIGYHIFIDGNGIKYQGRKLTEMGAHVGGQNKDLIGICLAGNFEEEIPSENQLKELWKSVEDIRKLFPDIQDCDINGHRDLAPSLCPGKNLYKRLLIYKRIKHLQRLIKRLIKLLRND